MTRRLEARAPVVPVKRSLPSQVLPTLRSQPAAEQGGRTRGQAVTGETLILKTKV
jgi:hypothetical protein